MLAFPVESDFKQYWISLHMIYKKVKIKYSICKEMQQQKVLFGIVDNGNTYLHTENPNFTVELVFRPTVIRKYVRAQSRSAWLKETCSCPFGTIISYINLR